MTTLPLVTFLDSDHTTGEMKSQFFEPMLDVQAETPGGGPEQALTIASGSITPAQGVSRSIVVDTEGSAATDDLDSVQVDNTFDGAILILRSTSPARVPRLRHSQGGSGQMLLRNSVHYALDDPDKRIALQLFGTSWLEIWRSHPTILVPERINTITGTSHDITGITQRAGRITITFSGFSTNGTSVPIIQLGGSSLVTTGYQARAGDGAGSTAFMTGFPLARAMAAEATLNGTLTLVLSDRAFNSWTVTGVINRETNGPGMYTISGNVILGSTTFLEQFQLTTVNGTDTTDGGYFSYFVEEADRTTV